MGSCLDDARNIDLRQVGLQLIGSFEATRAQNFVGIVREADLYIKVFYLEQQGLDFFTSMVGNAYTF